MKIKRLFTLAALLTASSLASALDTSDLKDQYYAGLNFGVGYHGGINLHPSIVIGYHYDKNSKIELETVADFSIKAHRLSLSPMINYRFYPDLDLDPVTLYVSAGLGGRLPILAGTAGGGGGAAQESAPPAPENALQSEPTLYADDPVATGGSALDKVLNYVDIKLKIGVDYAFTSQIIGAVGLYTGGNLLAIKTAGGIPNAVLELGIRYNF